MKKTKTLDQIRAERPLDAAARADVDAQKEALRVDLFWHELREHRGISQQDVADALHVSRPRVSTLERGGSDLRLSTLQRYVEALGGHLEIRAVFDDGDQVQLRSRAA